jgi:uncharacterized membrane protein HdeD (DUF308 family)
MSDPQRHYDDEIRDEGSTGARGPTLVVASATQPAASWGLLLGAGIVAIVFGILVLSNIWGSIGLVAILAGLFLLFAGVVQLATVGRSPSKGARVISGVLALIAGVALIIWPNASVKTIAVIVGISFLVWGLAMGTAAIIEHHEGWGATVGFGLLLALLGIVVMAWPGPTIAILMFLVGLTALIWGISAVVQSFALRRISRSTA